MANVLVIGGSRGIGKAVCSAAIERGHTVRAMSRRGEVSRSRAGDITSFRGDALSDGDITNALDGIDIVVQALGVPPSVKMITGPVTLFSEATRILLPEMERSGVSRLIAVTGFGAGDSASRINLLQRLPFKALLGRAYDDKTIQEDLIEKSSLDWLIVRPGVLTNGSQTGRYKVLLEPSEWRNGVISRAEVADYIAQKLDSQTLGRQKPVLIRYRL